MGMGKDNVYRVKKMGSFERGLFDSDRLKYIDGDLVEVWNREVAHSPLGRR